MPRRNSCRLHIHLTFTYFVGPSSVVWSKLGQAPPFPPMRVLEVQWSQALSLVCEMALSVRVLDSHSKAIPIVYLTWFTGLCVMSINLPLQGGRDANSHRPQNMIHSLPCRNSRRLFVHSCWVGPLSFLLLVWSNLERSRPFQPKRFLDSQWSHAFNCPIWRS
jgi:hypothetical protein